MTRRQIPGPPPAAYVLNVCKREVGIGKEGGREGGGWGGEGRGGVFGAEGMSAH